jgi:hypothetical protein
VSDLSFVRELGMKGKEGLVQKRTGSTQRGRVGCNFCGLLDYYICVRYAETNPLLWLLPQRVSVPAPSWVPAYLSFYGE